MKLCYICLFGECKAAVFPAITCVFCAYAGLHILPLLCGCQCVFLFVCTCVVWHILALAEFKSWYNNIDKHGTVIGYHRSGLTRLKKELLTLSTGLLAAERERQG